jgi:hypothetical protein
MMKTKRWWWWFNQVYLCADSTAWGPIMETAQTCINGEKSTT